VALCGIWGLKSVSTDYRTCNISVPKLMLEKYATLEHMDLKEEYISVI
jgi:hypothetical protein